MNLANLKRSTSQKRKFDIEELKALIDETGGKISVVARRLGCAAVTLYRYIEVDKPELKEYINEARRLDEQADVDSAEYVSKTLLDKLEEDSDKALKSAHYILKRRKAADDRGWITDAKQKEESTHSLAELAEKASSGELSQRD